MRYVASYLLAALGGNASPSAKDIKKILDSVGIEADDDRLNKVRPSPPKCSTWLKRDDPLEKRRAACASWDGYMGLKSFFAEVVAQW